MHINSRRQGGTSRNVALREGSGRGESLNVGLALNGARTATVTTTTRRKEEEGEEEDRGNGVKRRN